MHELDRFTKTAKEKSTCYGNGWTPSKRCAKCNGMTMNEPIKRSRKKEMNGLVFCSNKCNASFYYKPKKSKKTI